VRDFNCVFCAIIKSSKEVTEMPIYEYECSDCGKQFEVFQKFSEEPLSRCHDCGGHVHKLISRTSFILKGTGWYATDYASPERKKAEGIKNKSVIKTDTKTEAKTDTKTEAKAETHTKPKAETTVKK
jgi:putative FmdB family regulatory protein